MVLGKFGKDFKIESHKFAKVLRKMISKVFRGFWSEPQRSDSTSGPRTTNTSGEPGASLRS